MSVVIAGGGIAGLTMALTCHQIGVPATVLEAVNDPAPLGVGINLQPNAVRELYELGLADELPSVGIATREWALVGRNGNDIYAEPRGLAAGYRWPQYSVHRGYLQMLLLDEVKRRLGPDSVITNARVSGYENTKGGVRVEVNPKGESSYSVEGELLIGADGLHSAVRAQMYPSEGSPRWGGAVMWRGTTLAPPVRSGASFTLVGSMDQRFVHYPISEPDPTTGNQVQNWIAELSWDPATGEPRWPGADQLDTIDGDQIRAGSNWNRQVDAERFLGAFESWDFEWLDVPELVRGAKTIYEFPMVDRDPAQRWVDQNVALMGDAAHVMYPVGSNGASQAIVDARVLGATLIERGVNSNALLDYESRLHRDISALVLRNRAAGPVAMLGVVDDRCGGVFDDINEVVPAAEMDQFMNGYKQAAGFAIESLNNAPPIISVK